MKILRQRRLDVRLSVWRRLRLCGTEYDPAVKGMVTRQVTETRVLFSAKPACGQATELISGVTKQFKFSINVPAGARPTFQSVGDVVEWKIKASSRFMGDPMLLLKSRVSRLFCRARNPQMNPLK